MKLSILMLACMAVGAMVTLEMADGQNRSVPERLATLESTTTSTAVASALERERMENQLSELRKEFEKRNEHQAEQDAQLATIKGVGIGLSCMVMVLQLFQLLTSNRKGQNGK